MRRSNACRRKHIPSRITPDFGQVSENSTKVSASNERWDVLQQRPTRSYFAKYSRRVGPHIALVVLSALLSGKAERLARKPCGNDVDSTSPGVSVEGSDVIPDRESIEASIPLSLEQDSPAVFVDLNGADCPPSEQSACEQSSASSGK
jgi:hypothetical protein